MEPESFLRTVVVEYRRLPVLEAIAKAEREDRVNVLQVLVAEDRRSRVVAAANNRLSVLSTRGHREHEHEAEPAAEPAGKARRGRGKR